MATPNTLGIDFGTSNSAAGIVVDGHPHLIALEPGHTTLPTAVFFDPDTRTMTIGRNATQALINGDEGRFMRALKSLLGTQLMQEERRINGEKTTFVQIIARFLRTVKQRAEAETGQQFTHALSGRPVRFHSQSDTRNTQAEADLRTCYLAAGFEDVQFMFEPVAALHASPVVPGLGMIVDIGGGTSDFAVFEQPAEGAPQVLSSHGVRIGGTDFDRLISIDHVMPLLGRGSAIRNSFGNETMPAPNRMFNELATWQLIPFLYTAETRRAARDLAQFAKEPDKLDRLVSVLRDELGHDVAFAVEHAKIAVNAGDQGGEQIRLSMVERNLSADLDTIALNTSLIDRVDDIQATAAKALQMARVSPEQITRLVMVGGASLMTPVKRAMSELCPHADVQTSNAMTAVADGLARSASTVF